MSCQVFDHSDVSTCTSQGQLFLQLAMGHVLRFGNQHLDLKGHIFHSNPFKCC